MATKTKVRARGSTEDVTPKEADAWYERNKEAIKKDLKKAILQVKRGQVTVLDPRDPYAIIRDLRAKKAAAKK